MTNTVSKISSHQLDLQDSMQEIKNKKVQDNHINNEDNFKKVAKEMESLFAYQLLKVMRETTNSLSNEKKENGHDTYMSMFDIEVSKLFADRGMGLQDAIIKWLERSPEIADNHMNFNRKLD